MTVKEFKATSKGYDFLRIINEDGDYMDMIHSSDDTSEYDTLEITSIEPLMQVVLKGITLQVK